MAERRHGTPPSPTETTIRPADREFDDLDAESFRRVLFLDVDLSEMVDRGSTFEECARLHVRRA